MSENVDENEIKKFASLSHHWWDTEGELKTLHQINPLRMAFILEKTPLANKKVIDIGCGGGILTESMALLGADVTGIDLNKAGIDVAKLHLLESGANVEYLHTSAEAIARKRSGQYDVVTCLEMLEHVPDPKSIIQSCAALVKPGGHLFFSTLNRNLKSYLFAILGAEYVLKLLPKNTHDYEKFIRPSELSQFLRASGLHPETIKGIAYSVFSKQFSLTDDVLVNYLMHVRKPEQ